MEIDAPTATLLTTMKGSELLINTVPQSEDDLLKWYGTINGVFYPYFKVPGEPLLYSSPAPIQLAPIPLDEIAKRPKNELVKLAYERGVDMSYRYTHEELVKAIYEKENAVKEITAEYLVDEVTKRVRYQNQPAKSLPYETTTRPTFSVFRGLPIEPESGNPFKSIIIVGDTKMFDEFFEEHMMAASIRKGVYFAPDTPYNSETIGKFLTSLESVCGRYAGYRVVPQNMRSYGILGVETPYRDPPWLTAAIPGEWDPHRNPRRSRYGMITYSYCPATDEAMVSAIKKARTIQVGDRTPFDQVSPVLAYAIDHMMGDDEELTRLFTNMFQDSGSVFVASWSNHARTIHRTGANELVVMDSISDPVDYENDPVFKDLQRWLSGHGVTITAVTTALTQTNEGTCTLHAFARALAISAGVPYELPPPDEILVLAHRLMVELDNAYLFYI